eukprot:1178532-Prorocentrum_minimum.AAC.2
MVQVGNPASDKQLDTSTRTVLPDLIASCGNVHICKRIGVISDGRFVPERPGRPATRSRVPTHAAIALDAVLPLAYC